MFLGALAQSIPDIDFVAAFWNDTAAYLLAHRGFTHSILFAVIATILFGLVAEHYHKQHQVGYKTWLLFFGVQISIHLFLDVFNSYGVGLLEPFSHSRFSINTLFVADPFFSFWPAIAFVALLILKAGDQRRKFWWKFAITGCGVYLFYCSLNKLETNNEVRKALVLQRIEHSNFFTTPTPLNSWLWYIVVKDDTGYYIGYSSVLDKKDKIDFHYFPKADSLLAPVKDHEEVQHLLRFSQGYYTVEKWKNTIVFNDLRFGQIIGWHDPKENFVFHYFLQHPDNDNKLVVQRGRFAKWNWQTTKSLLRKIAGD